MTRTSPPANVDPMRAFWLPFTPNRQFKAHPKIITGAQGMFYETVDGQKILDGLAGLWCVNAGHGRQEIADAAANALRKLDYVSSFQMSHPAAFELATRLAGLAPAGLEHVFFCNSGSEAVDSALKIARAYHRTRTQGERIRFIGRERAYHGVGWGGLSVGGIGRQRRDFSPLLCGVDHLSLPYDVQKSGFSKGMPEWGAHFADELQRLVELHDASTIAAVVVEPVTGSGGVYPPPKGYLQKLRAICDRHGILLIFDEVITAFGRLGAAFGSDVLGVTPDIITCAKGLTNGAMPMGAVIVSEDIYNAFMSGPESQIELFHGYTYSAHPVACAVALATLDIYQDENLFTRAGELAPVWETGAHRLRGSRHVRDIRNLGLVGAIELKPRDGQPGARGTACKEACYQAGVLVRASGDTLMLSPPLIIDEAQIDLIFGTIEQALGQID
jgi:beta-alanine--pyruvate transaminase